MGEISGVDPLTSGRTMYDDEDVKGSSTIKREPAVLESTSVRPQPIPRASKIPNGTVEEQEEIAEGRVE